MLLADKYEREAPFHGTEPLALCLVQVSRQRWARLVPFSKPVFSGGQLLEQWNVLGEDPWAWFSQNVDYRKVDSTKPHQSHFVFPLGEEVWATRFSRKDAICLTSKTKFKKNVLWIKHAFRELARPTHIALYDITERKCLQENRHRTVRDERDFPGFTMGNYAER